MTQLEGLFRPPCWPSALFPLSFCVCIYIYIFHIYDMWKLFGHVRLCGSMDHTVHKILQARILEWVVVPFYRGSSQPRDRTQGSNPGIEPRSPTFTSFNSVSSVQSLSCVRLFVTPWIAACQASLSITNTQSSRRLTSMESVMPSSHLILCCPLLLLPQSLPASESFPMSQLFSWGGQSTGVSALASFLPKKSQGWSPPA